MICNAQLSNSSQAPAELKEHFIKQHGDGKYKDTTLAEFKVKRARFQERTLLIKPAALKMAKIMLRKAAEDKFSFIPLSNDSISSRIDEMSNGILAQVVANLISSPVKFDLQLERLQTFPI